MPIALFVKACADSRYCILPKKFTSQPKTDAQISSIAWADPSDLIAPPFFYNCPLQDFKAAQKMSLSQNDTTPDARKQHKSYANEQMKNYDDSSHGCTSSDYMPHLPIFEVAPEWQKIFSLADEITYRNAYFIFIHSSVERMQ